MPVPQRETKRKASNGNVDSRFQKQTRLSSDSESENSSTGKPDMHYGRNWAAGPGGDQEGNDQVSRM